jgi:hypothetical protein
VLRIFSSITAFRRQVRAGVLHLFKESLEHGVKVRVLIPADNQQITQIINEVNLALPEQVRYGYLQHYCKQYNLKPMLP